MPDQPVLHPGTHAPVARRPGDRKVRIGAVQFVFGTVSTWEEFAARVELFAQGAKDYACDFLVFPEYFAVQLFTMFSKTWTPKQTIHALADFAPQIQALLARLAVSYQLYLVGGSTVEERRGKLYNVSRLYTPAGAQYPQDKLHITPGEVQLWDIQPGDGGVFVFETSQARFGIQVCYDIEFPEIARAQALAGAELIFVPFSTGDRKSYQRVRYTAQARCIENYLYAVLSGNTGVLPHPDYQFNYARSAILTPSDLPYPPDGVAGEAEPTLETIVVADLDLGILELQRSHGTVRPLQDMRTDLYRVDFSPKVQVIQVA